MITGSWTHWQNRGLYKDFQHLVFSVFQQFFESSYRKRSYELWLFYTYNSTKPNLLFVWGGGGEEGGVSPIFLVGFGAQYLHQLPCFSQIKIWGLFFIPCLSNDWKIEFLFQPRRVQKCRPHKCIITACNCRRIPLPLNPQCMSSRIKETDFFSIFC